MFESQVEEYIGKVLVEEANTEGQFLNESEIAFRVTGMMYADKIKSDGPVSLRSIRGKMSKVRTMCDEKGLLLLPDMVSDRGGELTVVSGWKIATKEDINYIIETYFPDKKVAEPTSEPTAEAEE